MADSPHPTGPNPADLAKLEKDLEKVERAKREKLPFGEHPDGIGQTLGQDLGWEHKNKD